MKGIVLAGGAGTRLHPLTLSTSKQLLPVYDKPLVYYPLSVLMLAGIREILVVSTPRDLPRFEALLGDGSHLGLRLSYAEQDRPRGLADAFLVGADHVGDDPVALVLGDNVFAGPGIPDLVRSVARDPRGCVLFGQDVADPERFGVAEVDPRGRLLSLEEKPPVPRSRTAVTGLYVYDGDVVERARRLRPSSRGELEITDLNRTYLEEGRARLVRLGRGSTWFDTGTNGSLMAAAKYVEGVLERQGVRVACLEEIALRMGYIDARQCHRLGADLGSSEYGRYVMSVASAAREQRPVA